MDDEIVLVQLAEIDLGAARAELRGALQAAPAVGRRAAEKFRSREDDEVGRGITEAAWERAFDQFEPADFHFRLHHDFAEALDLAFGLEIDRDARAALAPGR